MTGARGKAPAVGISALRSLAMRGSLFAVLDACDEPAVLERVRAWGPERAVSLYRGQAEDDLAAIAPYLVQVDRDILDWLASAVWSEPWGVFIVARATLEDLRTHCRRLLQVVGPGGERLLFRFYDPRALVRFLGMATPEQHAELWGPIERFGVTDPDSYGVRLLSRDPRTTETATARVTLRLPTAG